MPELVNAYCTVDDLREQLGDKTKQNLSETQIVRCINAASRAIDQTTGRRFWADAAPVTKVFDVPAGTDYELWLPEDIAYTAGLVVTPYDGTAYTTPWAATAYRLWPYGANTGGNIYGGWWKLESTGTQRFDVRGTRGNYPLQITARFGWSFCPPQVEEACILLATQLFKRKDAPFGVAQFGDIAAVQVVRTDKHVNDLLWPFLRDVAMVA